ncbi:MAG TPA: putative metal-dependent hydrolase [Longimicrobiales bacterium]|nr:putative metal-dependent hydrolase [Longimicrobiales bacterium]
MTADIESLRYPVGRFAPDARIDAARRHALIDEIALLPAALRAAVAGLTDPQLDVPYRDGGWTLRQVVHHLPDSHMNAYIRFKLAVTEDVPTIKPYEEAEWARLHDSALPVEVSLRLLDALHERWVALLRSFDAAHWTRRFRHPVLGTLDLDTQLQLYAWHGRHHLGHITGTLARLDLPRPA